MSAGATAEDLRRMVQGLLVDRFSLQFHREKKLVDAYRLVAAGSNTRMERVETAVNRYVITPGQMDYEGISMKEFAAQLSSRTGLTVVDDTGLEGFCRFKVGWTNWAADKGPESEVFSAVRAQLGFAVKPTKLETEMLVIDKPNKVPTAN